MKYFYSAPTASIPPQAPHDREECPDDATLSLYVVHHWPESRARDAWEAQPGVTEYPLWTWNDHAPGRLVAALASRGANPADTVQQVLRRMGLRH